MPRAPKTEPPTLEPPRPERVPRPGRVVPAMGLSIADAGLVVLFLGLTFLLGVFPQHDTDFWWHLRTGDLIRRDGVIPRTDWYTFGAAGHSWIDLHWGFQVALSWLYSLGGVDATILAKCVVTTIAVALLLTARRPGWPIWVMVLAWLPALLLLGGRMYVRPESVTLLYLSIDLAVLFRIDRRPRLAWVLPVVQLLWVNTQGLFIFGPILIAMALVDAVLRRGAFAPERRAWWRTVLAATAATGVACFVNPYGLFGALYPIQLAGTMTNPVFQGIMELMSIPDFIARTGLGNLPLQLHFLTAILGALSFLLPVVWRVYDRAANPPKHEETPRRRKKKRGDTRPEEPPWRFSPFRFLLYLAFTVLSLRATRNSHQFAAVVGTVTAWNLGEWAAAIGRRRKDRAAEKSESAIALLPRLASAAVVSAVIALVGTGQFYAWTGESRTVGWGERALWFPHAAARFAGKEGMPGRFLVFHNGHAGVFEYHNGPPRKVFADARLEVMGPEVYGEDMDLGRAIASGKPGWVERVERLGNPTPGILVDHIQPASAEMAASVLGETSWRCVFYDPTASVYLHQSVREYSAPVDFAARHFGRDPETDPAGNEALASTARVLLLQAQNLIRKRIGQEQALAMAAPGGGIAHLLGATRRPRGLDASLLTLGQGYARRALKLDPEASDLWKTLGQIEWWRQISQREQRARAEPERTAGSAGISPLDEPDLRYRKPFDPLEDLAYARATHDLLEADRISPDDFVTLTSLIDVFTARGMVDAAAPLIDRLMSLPVNRSRSDYLAQKAVQYARVRARMSRVPSTRWANASELERVTAELLSEGFATTAVDLLERAYPPAERTWDQADRLATIRLHLGRPDLARDLWLGAVTVPRPAVREARVAATYLVEGDFESARKFYRAAIASEPGLFEAHFGLAVLERDAGHANEALVAAFAAGKSAGSDAARTAAAEIAGFVKPYVKVD